MKKIKTIEHIKAERKRINQQEEELENKMRSNWKELKESLRPVNIAKDAINSFFKTETEKNKDEEDIFKNSITYGFDLLAKKFADKAWEKLGKFFSR